MPDPDAYIALVASLPSPERLFRAKLPPLSRLRLERKLAALSPDDRRTLAEIEALMSWANYRMGDGDAVSVARARRLLAGLDSDTLHELVAQRMDMRAVVAALRLRRDGAGPPGQPWAATRLTRHIVANWAEPTFALDRAMPWLHGALTHLENRDPLGLERHILDVTYRQLQRLGARHHFDFEAVVIYVLKWNIFDRWALSDARAAARRFEAMADAALGQLADGHLNGGTT